MNYVTTFQRRNVATPSRKELKISSWIKRHSADQDESQSKIVKLPYFCIFMCICIYIYIYIYIYIHKKTSQIFCNVFFVKILPNHTTMSELPKSSVSKACQVLSTNDTQFLTKRLSVAIAIIGAFLYRGIPSDVQTRYEQPLNLPGTLLPR